MGSLTDFLEHDGMIEKTAKDWGEYGTTAAQMALGTAATYGVMEAISAAKSAVNRSRGYKRMLEHNPELKEMDAEGVKSMYNMMYKTAPTLSQNPYIAGGFVRRIEHQKKWMDPRLVSDLAETEAKINRAEYGPITGFPFEFGKEIAK